MRSDRMPIGRIGLAVALAPVLLGTACSDPKSFIVLELELAPGISMPITGVTAVEVKVSRGTSEMQALTYPAAHLTIDAISPNSDAGISGDAGTSGDASASNVDAAAGGDAGTLKTLSVSFTSDESGTISFAVSAIAGNCIVGRGLAMQVIRKGGVAEVLVDMTPANECPADGGTPDGGTDGLTFPGCDPVSPATGATMCASNQTCQVNCTTMRDECTMAGSGPPGSVCSSTNGNTFCQPGTQCFDYNNGNPSCTTTNVCLKFCNSDADCTAFGAGGGGPGSFCQGPVQCRNPTRDTGYHTCTFNCDPTAAAASTRGGCPGSLVCTMPATMDEVDCACPETTRTKTEGQACVNAADCLPGLVCNSMNGTKVCRAICRCNAVGGACSVSANTCPTSGTICRPVTNNTMFGVCLQ